MNENEALFHALIDGEREFEISQEQLDALDLAELSSEGFHVIRNHKGYRVQVISADYHNKSFVLRIGHYEISVDLKDAVQLQVESMGFERNSNLHIDEIVAPMPGLVLDVKVEPGDSVAEDDPLVILEAMKMENVLSAPRSGVIATVSVQRGDTVDKAQILVTFE